MSTPVTLAVDTSSRRGVVVVARRRMVLASATYDAGSDHAEQLLGHIERALHSAHVRLADVGRFGVSVGPGSFTGVRVGVSSIKAFVVAKPTPVVPVSSLEVLARAARLARWGREEAENQGPDGAIATLLAAGREDVFAGIVDGSGQLSGEVDVVPHRLLRGWLATRQARRVVGENLSDWLAKSDVNAETAAWDFEDLTTEEGLPSAEALAWVSNLGTPIEGQAVVDLEPAYARPPQITTAKSAAKAPGPEKM
jgi:tRNA threonylcarbamoyl adenosine modification protein YeaZ